MSAAVAARERCPGRHGRGDGEMKKVLSAFYYCIYTRSVRARVLFLYEINFNFNNFRAKKIIKTALVSPRYRRRQPLCRLFIVVLSTLPFV